MQRFFTGHGMTLGLAALAACDLSTCAFGDQDFLNLYFRGAWDALPWTFNATKTLYACHREGINGCLEGRWELPSVRVLHYTMAKPWDLKHPLHKGFERLNTLWWAAFAEPHTLPRVLLKVHLQEKRARREEPGRPDKVEVAEEVAEGVAAEDEAHQGSGLDKRAFDLHAILEKFKAEPQVNGEPEAPPEGAEEGGGELGLSALQEAALAIDALYESDDTAPMHWQDKAQLKKGLRGQVRRLVKDLGLDGWAKLVPQAVEHYAIIHYSKP